MGQEDRSHLWFRSTLESEISRWSTQLQAVANLNNHFFKQSCHGQLSQRCKETRRWLCFQRDLELIMEVLGHKAAVLALHCDPILNVFSLWQLEGGQLIRTYPVICDPCQGVAPHLNVVVVMMMVIMTVKMVMIQYKCSPPDDQCLPSVASGWCIGLRQIWQREHTFKRRGMIYQFLKHFHPNATFK